jgi:endonuclease/exonuclease/phosphatase family metal-dependent hydrolase
MKASSHFGWRAACSTAALLAALACSDADQPIAPDVQAALDGAASLDAHGRQPFTVYTQNAYLGGDTGPIFSIDFANIPAVIAATNTFWTQVRASRIPERAASMVDELDARRPHMVGLQEVTQFLVLDMGAGGAVVEAVDMLGSIQAEIARRGLPYELVRTQENSVVMLPLSPRLVLRTTDRLAVLRRTDVAIGPVASGNFAARFTLGPVTLKRGWIRVTAEHEGAQYNFVTTHLEVQRLAPVQAAQASELIQSVTAGLEGITMVTGDLNSDPEHPGAPSWTPTYDAMIAAGFTDLWTHGHGGDAGYTCCQAEDLMNAASILDERIDFVMARDSRPENGLQGAVHIQVVGEEQPDRTTAGLWRADHAGLFASYLPAPGHQPTHP